MQISSHISALTAHGAKNRSMEESLKRQVVHEAQELWNAGHSLEAGKLIFEHIPREHRPAWAAGVLEIARGYFPPSREIEAVLEFAKNPDRWGKGEEGRWREAHRIIDAVNNFPYLPPEPFPQTIVTLAKNVGKVVYNAQGYPAPFDHDAGWEIAETLKQIVQGVNDAEFTARAWATLCCERYIELEAPIMCHPACPVCYVNGLTPMSKGD